MLRRTAAGEVPAFPSHAALAGGGLFLAVAALIWANLPGAGYEAFWHTELTLTVGGAERVLDYDGAAKYLSTVVHVAVARILRTGAKLLLLDEISEGLAPVIVQTLARTIRTLRERGFTIVMVEQNFRFAAPLADRFYVMEHGRIVEGFSAAELDAKMGMLHEYLGV